MRVIRTTLSLLRMLLALVSASPAALICRAGWVGVGSVEIGTPEVCVKYGSNRDIVLTKLQAM
jgi:hypothetical protein